MVRAAVLPVITCIQCFSFIPVWNTSRGMGGIHPSNNTVILLCAVSFWLRARIVTNPHRRRWRHRPRHQGPSPHLATAKLSSSLPRPLPRLQALPSSPQDFIALPISAKLSSSPLPSSPVQEGILTLKSFDCHLIYHLT